MSRTLMLGNMTHKPELSAIRRTCRRMFKAVVRLGRSEGEVEAYSWTVR